MANRTEVHFDNNVMGIRVEVLPESAEFAAALVEKVKLYQKPNVAVAARLEGGNMVVDVTLTPVKAKAKAKAKPRRNRKK